LLRYLIIGGEAGLIIWLLLPFIAGVPGVMLAVPQAPDLQALGESVTETLSPLDDLWLVPVHAGQHCVQSLGLNGRPALWLNHAVTVGLPILTGALGGLAAFGLTCLIRRDRRPRGRDPGQIPPPDENSPNVPHPVDH